MELQTSNIYVTFESFNGTEEFRKLEFIYIRAYNIIKNREKDGQQRKSLIELVKIGHCEEV